MLKIPQGQNNDVNLNFEEILRLVECSDILTILLGQPTNILGSNKITKLPYNAWLKNIQKERDGPIEIIYAFLEKERCNSNKLIEKVGICYLQKDEQLKIKRLESRVISAIQKILQG